MHVTYGFHDILSRSANFHVMISERNVTCEVCADLALFEDTKSLLAMIRRLKIELTVGTLRIEI
jgi:hypothetical protein